MQEPEIIHARDRRRFELRRGQDVIGTSYYRLESGRRVFTHTEIDPDHRGQGLATVLIKRALDETRDDGLRVVALCPYVAGYIAKHDEYGDLLDSAGTAAG